jgi:hypothetical protein
VIIVVDVADRQVSLTDPDDFGRFSAEVRGPEDDEALAAVLLDTGLGRLHPDGAHVVVDPAALRGLAGAVPTVEWDAGLEAMCAYAAGKGWVEPDGGILAHIERDGR